MSEYNGKIYVGKAKYISGTNQNGDWKICKIWLPDVNEIAANMNAKSGINLCMVAMRQADNAGNTHTLFIDTPQPQQQGGQRGYQQQPPPRQAPQQQPPPRQAPQQQRPPYRQPQQPPPTPQDDGSFGAPQCDPQYNGVDDDIPF